jgi:hypothetical protein
MQGKFRVNADHFEDEEARMLYLFGRTTRKAQKHLQPRYSETSQLRSTSVQEMYQHLETIFVNPNKVRDAQFDYNRLTMKPSQTFVEFQTEFLYLAGEAEIPAQSLRLDLYDRLTTQLQEKLAAQLRTLDTFEELSASCQSLDTELRRIAARKEQQKRFQDKLPLVAASHPSRLRSATQPTATPKHSGRHDHMLQLPQTRTHCPSLPGTKAS